MAKIWNSGEPSQEWPADQNYPKSAATIIQEVTTDPTTTSKELQASLASVKQQIYFVGILRSNCLAGCQLEDEKSLAKRGRGSVDARVEKEERMTIVKWYDNRSVTLISSYCAVEPQDKARRWSKSEQAFVEVNRPFLLPEQP
ncbi:hypothetical protein QTP70_019644 [Hemibagrus guttatus]|uniref:PiggyBac transposable element-derived protein domain-containing protein n=1 Tax=Hemibagrus guttatus TaxID=175788 RepID=A0AAE0UIK9_9TELE|nr:hypothetical protein QTP70_019644 [Hemibagrus guttatus]KAK3523174.1 hypothetical protein QTP86_021712 [Hemibagrus guttatus]